jgi:hypothetical protein
MLELEERQEPRIWGYGMDEAFLDYQSSAIGPLLLQTSYIILGSLSQVLI